MHEVIITFENAEEKDAIGEALKIRWGGVNIEENIRIMAADAIKYKTLVETTEKQKAEMKAAKTADYISLAQNITVTEQESSP